MILKYEIIFKKPSNNCFLLMGIKKMSKKLIQYYEWVNENFYSIFSKISLFEIYCAFFFQPIYDADKYYFLFRRYEITCECVKAQGNLLVSGVPCVSSSKPGLLDK